MIILFIINIILFIGLVVLIYEDNQSEKRMIKNLMDLDGYIDQIVTEMIKVKSKELQLKSITGLTLQELIDKFKDGYELTKLSVDQNEDIDRHIPHID